MRKRHLTRYQADHQCWNRSGISTIWVIVTLPVVMAMFVFVIDIAHIWLARAELKNALDAAALSAVETWGHSGTTAQARSDANDTSRANTVLGTVVSLDINSGGCANGNVISTGEILLGAITDGGTINTFDCSATPSCISGTATVVIAVDTTGLSGAANGDTFTDPSDGGSANNKARRSFRVESFVETTAIPVGLTLNSLTIDLSGMMVTPAGGNPLTDAVPDDGIFDLRAIGTNDNIRSIGIPPVNADGDNLVPVNDQTVVPTFTFSPPGNTATVVMVTFAGGIASNAANSKFYFGVDTDEVGGNQGGGGGVTAQDFGGDFGTSIGLGNDPFTSTGAMVSVNISGQTVTGILEQRSAARSDLTLNVNIVSGGTSFAARTRKTIQVRSIGPTFLGLGLGPYNVSAESFAQFLCTNGTPRLIHVDGVTCVCP